jgi:hypothetical protein
MTTQSPPDPLLDALRAALPPARPTAAEAARVHRLARAALVEGAPAPLPRPPLGRTLLLAGAVAGYFTWAVLFVLATHLAR